MRSLLYPQTGTFSFLLLELTVKQTYIHSAQLNSVSSVLGFLCTILSYALQVQG